jgi:hypothetical protein
LSSSTLPSRYVTRFDEMARYGGDELRCVADEPRVAVVLGRARLPRDRLVRERGRPPRSARDDTLEQLRQEARVRARKHALSHRVVHVQNLSAGARDLRDRTWLVSEDLAVDAITAVRERRVRARHLERVDGL